MSLRVDVERRESAVEHRTEVGKERLRLAQMVLACFVEGLGLEATATRVGQSTSTVWRVRVWLGVQSGRRHRATGQRVGRRDTRRAILEVTP